MVTYSYDAWGNILSTSGTLATTLGVNNPIRYRGYYYDEESGFYYLGSRYYDPYYGSFISKDSVESGDLWGYCDNDPVNNVDPTGYWIDTALDVISLTLSVYDLVKDPTWENGAYVALDVAFLALPFVAGAGASLKFVSKADDIVDATRAVGKLDDMVDAGRGMANVMDAVSDTGRVVNNVQNGTSALKYADEGYDSFKAFKKANGPAGPGKEWHHIVEQSQIAKSGFSPKQIHNKNNMVAIDKDVHGKITGYYNSKQWFTDNLSVRNWLAGQSFDFQYNYGMMIYNNALRGLL